MLSSNGPAQPMCTRYHGLPGHSHGCKFVFGGNLLCSWQTTQLRTLTSISASSPGHHTKMRAKAFIRTMPGRHSLSPSSNVSRPSAGITTRDPHSKQPCFSYKVQIHSNVASPSSRNSQHSTALDLGLSIVLF